MIETSPDKALELNDEIQNQAHHQSFSRIDEEVNFLKRYLFFSIKV